MSERLSILLIGPRSSPSGPVGGTTVLMQEMINQIDGKAHWKFIPTNRFSLGFIVNGLWTTICFLIFAWRFNTVLLNVSQNGFRFLAPFLAVLSFLSRKEFLLRAFGGDIDELVKPNKGFVNWVFCYVTLPLSKHIFVETRRLVAVLNKHHNSVHWFPNSRRLQARGKVREQPDGRACFVGTIKRAKGVECLVAAFSDSRLRNIKLDLWGPVEEEDLLPKICNTTNCKYRGITNPSNMTSLLEGYDVLVLPTFWKGEGYPGVVIEAFGAGVPVVVSDWKDISELMNKEAGRLVTPGEKDSLIQAILEVLGADYASFSKGALARFEMFEATSVHTVFFKVIGK